MGVGEKVERYRNRQKKPGYFNLFHVPVKEEKKGRLLRGRCRGSPGKKGGKRGFSLATLFILSDATGGKKGGNGPCTCPLLQR